MGQALHILRKDVRRLWIELAISLGALGILTWTEWGLATPMRNHRWYNEVLPVIVLFLAWWLLVVRLIHGEALVGDRQFWITRPYVWHKLLAAKALFILGCIAAPSAISEAVLVVANGSPLASHLGRILLDTAGVMLVAILPVAALAAITKNLGQWVLSVVGLIAALIGMAVLDSSLPSSQMPAASAAAETIEAVVVACLCIAGLLVQYSSRRTFRGALFVIAAVISVPLIMIATPYRRIIDWAFPIFQGGPVPVRVAFPGDKPQVTATPSENGGAVLNVTVKLSVSQDGTFAMLDAAMLSIGLPQGRRWESEWHPLYTQLIERTSRNVELRFNLDRNIYDTLGAGRAEFKVALAFSQLKDANHRSVVLYRHFDLPGVGYCWIEGEGYRITCRSTEIGPSRLLASQRAGSADSRVGYILGLNSTLGPLSPLIIQEFHFGHSNAGEGVRPVQTADRLDFSAPETVRRFRLELMLGAFQFPNQRLVAAGGLETIQ